MNLELLTQILSFQKPFNPQNISAIKALKFLISKIRNPLLVLNM